MRHVKIFLLLLFTALLLFFYVHICLKFYGIVLAGSAITKEDFFFFSCRFLAPSWVPPSFGLLHGLFLLLILNLRNNFDSEIEGKLLELVSGKHDASEGLLYKTNSTAIRFLAP